MYIGITLQGYLMIIISSGPLEHCQKQVSSGKSGQRKEQRPCFDKQGDLEMCGECGAGKVKKTPDTFFNSL